MVATENAMPPMWNMGSAVQIRSSGVRKKRVRLVPSANRIRASWLSSAPFGSAAVPEVYMTTAGSRTLTSWRRRSRSRPGTASPAAAKLASVAKPVDEVADALAEELLLLAEPEIHRAPVIVRAIYQTNVIFSLPRASVKALTGHD